MSGRFASTSTFLSCRDARRIEDARVRKKDHFADGFKDLKQASRTGTQSIRLASAAFEVPVLEPEPEAKNDRK
jgi:hypothetical protein